MFNDLLKTAGLCLAVALGAVAAGAAAAETYPAQPIKIIVGFGPASAADILTRLVGRRMEARPRPARHRRKTGPATAA